MRKQFYVYKRNGAVFYMQFTDPITGKSLTPHSTGKRTEQEAIDRAYQLLYSQDTTPTPKLVPNFAQSFLKLVADNKIPQNELLQIQQSLGTYSDDYTPSIAKEIPQEQHQAPPQAQQTISEVVQQIEPTIPPQTDQAPQAEQPTTPLTQWLKDFWNFETSEYVQDKISHGKRVSQRYCYEQTNVVKYWEEYFSPDFTLEELDSKQLELFEKYLWEKEIQKKRTCENPDTGKKFVEIYTTTLSTTTRNNIIKCASIAFEWAVRKHIMSENPCNSLTAYSIKSKERGILDRKEVGKLFTEGKWKDEKAKIASLVGMTTGLRISEIQALQKDDIGDDRLYISHSWNTKDGLTTTKNDEKRIVALVPKVRTALLSLCLKNPHQDNGDTYVFWGNLPDRPVVSNVLTDDFKSAMESIGISETMRQRRNIVFHSWRHFYATTISTELSEKHAQLTLGHLTAAMTKHYADHKTEEALLAVCDASNDIFTSMLG